MENILRNGLRQTPAGSRLSVTLTATSRFVRISLCDQGPGMPPEEIEHAFDSFVRCRLISAALKHAISPPAVLKSALICRERKLSAKYCRHEPIRKKYGRAVVE